MKISIHALVVLSITVLVAELEFYDFMRLRILVYLAQQRRTHVNASIMSLILCMTDLSYC